MSYQPDISYKPDTSNRSDTSYQPDTSNQPVTYQPDTSYKSDTSNRLDTSYQLDTSRNYTSGNYSASDCEPDNFQQDKRKYESQYQPYTYIQGMLCAFMIGAEITLAVIYDPLSNYGVTYIVIVLIIAVTIYGRLNGCDARNSRRILPVLWLVTGIGCVAEIGVCIMQVGLTGARWKEPDETFWYVYMCEGLLILFSALEILAVSMLACKPLPKKPRRRTSNKGQAVQIHRTESASLQKRESDKRRGRDSQKKISIYFPE